ncbi:DedA family protein [Streptosporangium sp. KLBMP 9127]|nr:DedA family protein [Streptosporangium sp. KLBMP 9127]
MTDAIIDLLHQVMTSPWVYLALFTVALIDGFFPVVPSETSVITAGVFAATGDPNVFAVIAVAALGAFAGDHVSYLIGRTGGARVRARLKPGTARHKAFSWAERALAERGGLVLVVARYIPGGRTATTITMGAVGYPLRSFSIFDSLAAGSWAIYSVMIGYLGGLAFEQDPIKGLLLGLGIAFTITALVEAVRYVRKRRAPVREEEPRVLVSPEG